MINVALINESTAVTDAQVQTAMAALQIQVSRDFAPAWGIDAQLNFIADKTQNPLAPGQWQLIILDNSDQAGALGYHDLTDEGLPMGKVFAGTDIQYGSQWTVTASHELLEMLADPDINLTAFIESGPHSGILYAYEVADAVEDDSLGYQINGTLVSDFVLPSWFETFQTNGPFDYQKQVQSPLQLLSGGYIGIYDIKKGGGWTQLTADQRGERYETRPRVGSRRDKRRTPRSFWLKSARKHV